MINFIRISSVLLVYQTACDYKFNGNLSIILGARFGTVVIQLDKTGIISQTSITSIKFEGFLGFKVTE